MNRILTEKFLITSICCLLFIIPILLMGDRYIVGGDDMKLYYIYPDAYLKNYTFNLISDNSWSGALAGYTANAYFAPFFATIWVLKTLVPFMNTQALLYGLNFVLAFLFFYKILSLYIDTQTQSRSLSVTAKVIASFAYIFSPFLDSSLFSHQMMHMYLVSLVPVCLYLFVRGIRSSKIHYVLGSVLVFSLFSTTYNAMPYFAAYLVCLLPILLYEMFQNKTRFVFYGLLSALVFLCLNMYWIFHLLNSSLSNTGLPPAFGGEIFENENVRIASGVSRMFSPLNQLFQTTISGQYFITDLFQKLQVIPVIIILVGAYQSSISRNTRYFVVLLSFLLSWYFFSPNFADWGPSLFVWLTQHVPFWGMFRNMYDKFAPALAFCYALCFGVSLHFIIITKFVNLKRISYVICIILLAVTFTHIPRIINPFASDRESMFRITGKFNNDFQELITYLSNDTSESRVLWLPLNVPTYTLIKDTESDSYYSGLSPLRVLSDRTDIAGRFSFLTQNDIFLGDKVFSWLKEKEYVRVANLLRELNVSYVIVNHEEVPQSLQSFYYGTDSNLLEVQGKAFQEEILGKKIQDFGSTYSLYYINDKYRNDKFMITSGELTYKKTGNDEYSVKISNLSEETTLAFLEPFNNEWKIELLNNGAAPIDLESKVIYDYANSWRINPTILVKDYSKFITMNSDGSIDLVARIYFYPKNYNMIIYTISIVSAIIVAIYILFQIMPYTIKNAKK